MRTVCLFAAFLLVLGVWTWKLLEPSPVPDAIGEEIPTDLKFLASKVLHVGMYALLTLLAAFLPVRRPYFWAVVTLLAAHGVGTEVGQSYVVNRHGSARDVLLDWLGIVAGLILFRLWERRRPGLSSPANLLSVGRVVK